MPKRSAELEVVVSNDAPLRTPQAWAEALGHATVSPATGELCYGWEHLAARALHGWGEHEHETGSAMALTQADYEAALAAVLATPPLAPHQGALSPHAHAAKGA